MRPALMVLLLACAALALASPLLALQEYAHHLDGRAREALVLEEGALPDPGPPAFREMWRPPILVLVLLVGILATWAAFRAAREEAVREVSGRVLGLVGVGLTLLDVGFLLDVRWMAEAPALVRAMSVVWTYALGALLVGGSAYRLADLQAAFGRNGRPHA